LLEEIIDLYQIRGRSRAKNAPLKLRRAVDKSRLWVYYNDMRALPVGGSLYGLQKDVTALFAGGRLLLFVNEQNDQAN
jgi:hypothetical protein